MATISEAAVNERSARRRPWWLKYLAVAGPGLIVAFADTEAGSVTTAAVSGAQFGMKLVLLQLLLIVPLFVVQEMTVRLGTISGKGHAALIRERYGLGWAWVSLSTMLVTNVAALITEFIGIAGVALIFGLPAPVFVLAAATLLIGVAFSGRYKRAEYAGLALCLLELLFIPAAFAAHPSWSAIYGQGIIGSQPLGDRAYLLLVAGNIGAVIMPWMVFFQQSSIVEKKLTTRDLAPARLDTAVGAVLTQLIMAAVLVAVAATLGKAGGDRALDTVQEISEAITPFLGKIGGDVLFALGMSGAALVATIVVTLTAARTLAEVLGVNHGLHHEPAEAPWFYGAYAVALVVGAVVVGSGVNLVALSVGVQVMNALLLPIVLTFLFLLAQRLPDPFRLKGAYAWIAGALIAVTTLFGVYAGIAGLWG